MTDVRSTFLKLAGSLDHPLLIVTASDGERREGCVIGFATQSRFSTVYFQEVKDGIESGHPVNAGSTVT